MCFGNAGVYAECNSSIKFPRRIHTSVIFWECWVTPFSTGISRSYFPSSYFPRKCLRTWVATLLVNSALFETWSKNFGGTSFFCSSLQRGVTCSFVFLKTIAIQIFSGHVSDFAWSPQKVTSYPAESVCIFHDSFVVLFSPCIFAWQHINYTKDFPPSREYVFSQEHSSFDFICNDGVIFLMKLTTANVSSFCVPCVLRKSWNTCWEKFTRIRTFLLSCMSFENSTILDSGFQMECSSMLAMLEPLNLQGTLRPIQNARRVFKHLVIDLYSHEDHHGLDNGRIIMEEIKAVVERTRDNDNWSSFSGFTASWSSLMTCLSGIKSLAVKLSLRYLATVLKICSITLVTSGSIAIKNIPESKHIFSKVSVAIILSSR